MRDQSSVVPGLWPSSWPGLWPLFLPRAVALLALLVMAGGTAACGQKGPLSLPPAAGAASSPSR